MRWLLPVLGILALVIHFSLLHYFAGLDLGVSIIDTTINTSILALCIWGMLLVVNAYPTRVGGTVYALLISTLFAFLAGYGSWYALKVSLGKDDEIYLH